MNIEEYFLKLRFDKNHHLGLGDIRLTLGQQDEIIAAFAARPEEQRIQDVKHELHLIASLSGGLSDHRQIFDAATRALMALAASQPQGDGS